MPASLPSSYPARKRNASPGLKVFTGLFLLACANPGSAAENDNRFEKQFAPVPAAAAGEWWMQSWREGWTYQHRGDFSLAARVRVREKAQVHWWQALTSGVEDYIGELNLEVRGNSLAESGVIQNRNGEILLSRYYPRTDVTRAIFRKPVGDPTIVDKALEFLVDDGDRLSLIKNIMQGLFGSAAVALVPNAPTTAASVGAMAGGWVGEKADDLISAQLKQHGIQKRPDGGVEISPTSSLLQFSDSTKTLADLANLAVHLNEAFNRRLFLVRASSQSGEELDTRQIFNEGRDLVTVVEKKESEGVGKAAEWLKGKMPAYQQPPALVRGVIQRETFALSSKVFDSTERKPGDVWVVPADFFNSFLHPDLQGSFRGNVVLTYVRDTRVPDRYDSKKVFEAREIEISYKGKVDGRTHHSTLEYVEPNFSAKLSEDAEGVLFLDKADGYVRQADLMMNSDVQAGLPDMKILQGFDVAGDARFEVHYTCIGAQAQP